MKKTILIIFPLFAFILFLIFYLLFDNSDEYTVLKVISPAEIYLSEGKTYKNNECKTFDAFYSDNNKQLAKQFYITEDEAFILGNFGKYWTKGILENRRVLFSDNELIYHKFGYNERLKNSPFCILGNNFSNKSAFERQLKSIRHGKFVIADIDNDKIYPISKENAGKLKNYIVVRKSHIKHLLHKENKPDNTKTYNCTINSGSIKLIVSDHTTKIIPDRNCSSDICKEILYNINNAKSTIDMAIYGYSSTPQIENAFKNAIERGVKIRMVYDSDSAGENIYPDTFKLVKLISTAKSDINSSEAGNSMHNKFFVFDSDIVITGSANLSHTDMSGFNSNSIIVIKSKDIAQIYTNEFNQMFDGKFHTAKSPTSNNISDKTEIYFSPQDKTITNGVLPQIRNAKKYIYIPCFVITEKRVAQELINAKNRGVDVKIIIDALNAVNNYSKVKDLRMAGISVKAENYAGKMHSKSIITDDKYLLIGSMNLSNSGEKRNDENMIVLKDSDLAKFYKQFFLYQWNKIPDRFLKYTPRAESKDSIGSCSDGIDNDYDGLIDKADEGCI